MIFMYIYPILSDIYINCIDFYENVKFILPGPGLDEDISKNGHFQFFPTYTIMFEHVLVSFYVFLCILCVFYVYYVYYVIFEEVRVS